MDNGRKNMGLQNSGKIILLNNGIIFRHYQLYYPASDSAVGSKSI
jgi:hypothetical protein